MKIVAYMQVGNEVALIDAVISHTLALGVDGFVIVDAASHDGTAEALRAYVGDPRFDIVFLDHDQVYGPNPPDPIAFGREMIARMRARFDPDWVLRLDADEFWLTDGATLQ
ncbi:glycosyltransferase family 2 protein [Aestuariicoccus sp. MJ-SS9]|uniref:glycosyltransferase family 2 protein n=1 Tax=Aestuariicoccus sp. MJ-SS9 TaxID=3079855 RepID=UPI00290B8D87|nr:glycosyltransferase family 2 protein [Aestuariicoccus sp. MJ-SS9]MDU8909788.1 glycosyltransferase family 2 protein [Aestuariicoccus sp. MJ-SS9]